MKNQLKSIQNWLGIGPATINHKEKWIATLGALLSIVIVWEFSLLYISDTLHLMMVASMGASAVLLFAVPHGPLSQPWAVIGGHTLSALVGISCALLIPNMLLAAALAVALSIWVMITLRCIHPPGGATALTAVIGGEAIHQLGYQFAITPVLIDSLLMVMVAFFFNNMFEKRRYPIGSQPQTATNHDQFSHQEFLTALKEIDSFVDVHESELNRIINFLIDHHKTDSLTPDDIRLGCHYSNGKIGSEWSIRQIIDEAKDNDPEKDFVIFRQQAGKASKTSDCVTRSEFAQWAKYRVIKEKGQWHRAE